MVGAAAGAALVVGALLLFVPLNSHDEPIIVENGPVRIDFKTRGHQPNELQWIKSGTLPPTVIRFWKDKVRIEPCGQGTDCQLDTSKPVHFGLEFESIIDFKVSSEIGNAVIMDSTRLAFNKPGLFTPAKITAKDNAARIKSVSFTLAKDQGGKEVILRDGSGTDPKDVKVALCVKVTDEAHCPN